MLGAGPIVDLNNVFSLFGFLKMLRVFRLGKMISKTNLQSEVKAVLNLMKLVFYLLLYVHGVGCFWWLTCTMGYPDMYYIDLKNNLYIHSDLNVGLDLTANDEKLKK